MTTCFDCMQHKREILQLKECVHLAAAQLPPCLTNAFGFGRHRERDKLAATNKKLANAVTKAAVVR